MSLCRNCNQPLALWNINANTAITLCECHGLTVTTIRLKRKQPFTENPAMLTWENTTGMEFIEATLTLVTHNATFNAELSKNTDPAADVNEELSKATNPAPDFF